MNEVMIIKLLNEMIPFFLLLCLSLVLYKGLRRNQILLSEREELLKRYLLFRGDRQVRLKIYGEDEKIYKELLKNISNSWKHFKKVYDQCLQSLARNTHKTRRLIQLITLGLLINSIRLFIEDYYFYGFEAHLFYTLTREVSYYVLVSLSFLLLRVQTQKFLTLKGEVVKMDREILFFPNHMTLKEGQEVFLNEFDPLETGGEDEKEDSNPCESS